MIAAYVGEGAESSGDDDIALNVLEQQVDLLNAKWINSWAKRM